MKLFYSDQNLYVKSYTDLINDINLNKSFCFISNHEEFYLIFKDIIVSLLANKHIFLIDDNLSEEEINRLNLSKELLTKEIECDFKDVVDENDLLNRIKDATEWEMTLYTSGTTGKPKRITHTLRSLTKAVVVNDNTKNNIWGFAYNPTHIAGVQVFFQALMNLNHIVRLFLLSKNEIFLNIQTYKITNISATPTFYRLLLDEKKYLLSVKNITMGGEKYSNSLSAPLKKLFPNAKILNIYASTEIGTLLASNGDVFLVKAELKQFVKIVDDELFVSSKLIGKSEDVNFLNGWFCSGDRVEIITKDPLSFRFIGRINESINVGGYKVYPTEVEEILNQFDGVRNSYVYSQKNSVLGNIILCDVEKNDDSISEAILKSYLSKRLQPYKIPCIINFVEEIKVTRTGKIERK